MTRSTEQVFQDHVSALMRGDLPAIMADYDDDSVLLTLEGALVGREAIQAFFAHTLGAMSNVHFESLGVQVHGECVLCAWNAEFDGGAIPHGVDSFVIRDDRIRLQTGWFPVVPR
jgi:ketosteroid isomerase-like protein